MRVVINPGHAVTSPGAQGERINEAEVVQAVARALVALSGDGITYEGKRQEGKDLAGLLYALRANKPDVVLSLHLNAPSMKLHRADIYWYLSDPNRERARQSHRLAGLIATEAMSDDHHFAETAVVKTAPYARGNDPDFTPGILVDTASKAIVLVELAFITDKHSEAFFMTPEGQQKAARALDTAVRKWAK